MTRRLLPLIAAAIACLSLSGPWADRARRPAGTAEPAVLWPSRSVSVCFATPALANRVSFNSSLDFGPMQRIEPGYVRTMTEREKSVVREIVRKEYTLEDTGLEFTGFADCDAAGSADVLVFVGDLGKSRASLGRDGQLEKVGEPDRVILIGEADAIPASDVRVVVNAYSRKAFVYLRRPEGLPQLKAGADDFLRINALHEFGHVAGLRHEHARPEAARDRRCKNAQVKLGEAPFGSTRFMTAYDSYSIMNYCHTHTLFYERGALKRHPIRLSRSDRHTLLCLYDPEGPGAADCRPDFHPAP